jgi:hypothetical protein
LSPQSRRGRIFLLGQFGPKVGAFGEDIWAEQKNLN